MRWITFLLMAGCFIGGCASTPEYGSRGPGEQWHFSHAFSGDEGHDRTKNRVGDQRSWGWASQFVLVNDDGSVDELVIGPGVYSQDNRVIDVSYFVISKVPVSGRITFEASPERGYRLPESWAGGIVREVEVSGGSATGLMTLPVIGVPTDGVVATWEGKR